jgi:parallel beta-helix repeat protein
VNGIKIRLKSDSIGSDVIIGVHMKKKWIYTIIGLILIAIITSIVVTIMIDYFSEDKPVLIYNDDDFLKYKFQGDGSKDNPFIIENYNITTTSGYAIYIRSTTKYFTIRNCLLEASTSGISINSIASGTGNITMNTCRNSLYGIEVDRSVKIHISKNVCYNNYHGIHLSVLSDAILIDNYVKSNFDYGIYLNYNNNTVLEDNYCRFNSESGIIISNSFNTTIVNNTCIHNSHAGIYSYNSLDNSISNNTIKYNDYGLLLYSDSNCNLVIYNYFRENFIYAIAIDIDSTSNLIHHNSFINSSFTFSSQARDDGTNNTWFDKTVSEGNYWSNWVGTGNYTINGFAQANDTYPLINPPVTTQIFSQNSLNKTKFLSRSVFCTFNNFILKFRTQINEIITITRNSNN